MPTLRKRIAKCLKDSQNTLATVTTFTEPDMTNLMKLWFDYKDESVKKHGGKLGLMSCFVKEEEQGRLPTRGDFMKFPATPWNIRLQTPRHPSLQDRRGHPSNQGPPRFVHKATPARLMRRARSTHNYFLSQVNFVQAKFVAWKDAQISKLIDKTNLMKLRSDYKDEFVKKHGVRLGLMSCFVKAVVSGLQNQPIGNDVIDITVVVGTSKGLVVPVIRDADTMSFAVIEKGINNLAKKATLGAL